MIGGTYLLSGEPVVVLARWQPPVEGMRRTWCCCQCGGLRFSPFPPSKLLGDCEVGPGRCHWKRPGTVRNVLLRREDGSLLVRPFRGLRKPKLVAA